MTPKRPKAFQGVSLDSVVFLALENVERNNPETNDRVNCAFYLEFLFRISTGSKFPDKTHYVHLKNTTDQIVTVHELTNTIHTLLTDSFRFN